jgi:hypothetical protein
MKQLTTTLEDDGKRFKIHDYPNAVWLGAAIESEEVDALRSFALHEHDLSTCQEALNYCAPIVAAKDPGKIYLVQTLWTGIVARYIKCFNGGVRMAPLDYEYLFPTQDEKDAHQYFFNLRNKHLVHDANGYSQVHVAVVVNPVGAPCKVGDIVSHLVEALPSLQHLESIAYLVKHALAFVRQRRSLLHISLGLIYEQKSHNELMALPAPQWRVPTHKDVGRERQEGKNSPLRRYKKNKPAKVKLRRSP